MLCVVVVVVVVVEWLNILEEKYMFFELVLAKKYFVVSRWLDVRFVSRPVEIVIFPVKNGETPKSVVDFLRVKDTFRKNMEIVKGSVEKYNKKGLCVCSQTPWRSSKISHFTFFCFHVFFILKKCSSFFVSFFFFAFFNFFNFNLFHFSFCQVSFFLCHFFYFLFCFFFLC